MSALLDQAACEDAQRREDLARSEAEMLAADLERDFQKAAKAHARNDLAAAQADMQWLDAMRRNGAL